MTRNRRATAPIELAEARDQGYLNIGQAAAASGVSAKMIRHYESTGLIPEAGRTFANYRLYSPSDVHTLQFVRRARDLGFSLPEIKELIALWHDRSRKSADVRRIAQHHVEELGTRIAELEAMRRTLQHLAACCHGDSRPDCPILDDLAAPHAGAPDHRERASTTRAAAAALSPSTARSTAS